MRPGLLIAIGLVALAFVAIPVLGSADGGEEPDPQQRPPGSAPVQQAPPVAEAPPDASQPLVEAGFEDGLAGWNLDGVGDVAPTIGTDLAREGSGSAAVTLTGSQNRSELILDGRGSSLGPGTIKFSEGQGGYFAFSFLIESMQYGRPGAHNLIMQLKSDGTGSPLFGLQLWDYESKRGLWSTGDAMGGDRYLAPVEHQQWNDVVIRFVASRVGQGGYEVYLNGNLIDSGDGVSMIEGSYAYIKAGLYRNGAEIPGTSVLRLDSGRLGASLEVVTPL